MSNETLEWNILRPYREHYSRAKWRFAHGHCNIEAMEYYGKCIDQLTRIFAEQPNSKERP